MTIFHLAIACITVHELDAIRCKEWRIFPLLSRLQDKNGFIIFTLLHIPLFYWVFNQMQGENIEFRLLFDAFLIIHLGLHLILRKHAKNEFRDWFSWLIIIAAAFFGALDLSIYMIG
ncbi:MAG: hypothetical protein JXQ87_11665 [Bacteroidia bacterium]